MMVASGAVSACRTKLPTLTVAALMRPEIGARMVQIAELNLEIFQGCPVLDSAKRARRC